MDHEHARPHRFESISVWGHQNESGELPPPAIIHPVEQPEVVGA